MFLETEAAEKFEVKRMSERKSNNKKNQGDLASQIKYRKDQRLYELKPFLSI